MKKTNLYLFFVLCIYYQQQKQDIAREAVNFEVITDSIFTRMPSTIIQTSKYWIWHNPFTTDNAKNNLLYAVRVNPDFV